MLQTALLGIFLLMHISAGAASLDIDALPPAHCESEPASDGYYDKKSGECVLGFSKELGSLVVSVNGKLVPLTIKSSKTTKHIKNPKIPSIGTHAITQLTSLNAAIQVVLDITIVDSSCTTETESCCGDDYIGTIQIRQGKSRITKKVRHYSGG